MMYARQKLWDLLRKCNYWIFVVKIVIKKFVKFFIISSSSIFPVILCSPYGVQINFRHTEIVGLIRKKPLSVFCTILCSFFLSTNEWGTSGGRGNGLLKRVTHFARDNNHIIIVTVYISLPGDHHILLWTNTTTFLKWHKSLFTALCRHRSSWAVGTTLFKSQSGYNRIL